MHRVPLVVSFLCAVLGVAPACRESRPSPRLDGAPVPKDAAPPLTISVPPPSAPEAASENLHRRWEITVKAGSLAREAQMVTVTMPIATSVKSRGEAGGLAGGAPSVRVREPKGSHVPSQMQGNGQLAFHVKALKAGGQAIYLAEEGEPAAASGKGGVLAVQDRDAVKLSIDGKPILAYRTQRQPERKDVAPEYWRNGYLHPVYTPAGVLVTDDYPKDKPYQHGIWSGWQKVEFQASGPDFWDSGLKKGRVSMESVGPLWGGPLVGGLGSHQFFTDLDRQVGTTALRESWWVTAFRAAGRAPYFVVDLESRQEVMNGTVTLGENAFGGITLRGNRDWQGTGKSVFLTSEGHERGQAQGAPARWCYLGGKSGGKRGGVAILAHPRNPKAPEAVFIDPEAPVMGFAPSKKGPIDLKPRWTLILQYRFVVLDGKPDSRLFDRLWNDFANPPVVEVRELTSK